jgi:hypothetical protein
MDGRHEAESPDAARVVDEWVADGAATGLFFRRRHRRWARPVTVALLIEPGTPSEQRIFGTGEDVSESGMGLVVRRELLVGTDILVRDADEGDKCPWVPARVMHSERVLGGYRIGVEFQVDSTG